MVVAPLLLYLVAEILDSRVHGRRGRGSDESGKAPEKEGHDPRDGFRRCPHRLSADAAQTKTAWRKSIIRLDYFVHCIV